MELAFLLRGLFGIQKAKMREVLPSIEVFWPPSTETSIWHGRAKYEGCGTASLLSARLPTFL